LEFIKKVFPKPHRATLISVSVALSQTQAYAARPWIQGLCIAWSASLHHSYHQYQIVLVVVGVRGCEQLAQNRYSATP